MDYLAGNVQLVIAIFEHEITYVVIIILLSVVTIIALVK